MIEINDGFLVSLLNGETPEERLSRIRKGPLGFFFKPSVIECFDEFLEGKTLREKLGSLHKIHGHECYPTLLMRILGLISWYCSKDIDGITQDLDESGNSYLFMEMDVLVKIERDYILSGGMNDNLFDSLFDPDRFGYLHRG